MQFIIKQNSSSQLFFKKLTKFYSQHFLYTLASIVLFSTGFMFGLFWNLDSNCLNFNSNHHTLPNDLTKEFKLTRFLIVLIMSNWDNQVKRETIRQTWLQLINQRSISYYFVINSFDLNDKQLKLVKEEANLRKDLVLLSNVQDIYTTLTSILLLSFKWIQNRFNFKYLLKVNDDSFAQIDIIFDSILKPRNKDKALYLGYFDGRASVKKFGKFNESNWFLCDRYLPYALSGGYIISSDLIEYIMTNLPYLQLYNSEDVSLGVWLSPLKIERIHETRFDTESKSRGCSNNYLITHKQSVQKMKEKFNNLSELGKLCKVETIYKNGYNYNWKVLPSSCCYRNVTLH